MFSLVLTIILKKKLARNIYSLKKYGVYCQVLQNEITFYQLLHFFLIRKHFKMWFYKINE
jgi:hypothetical protein